MTALIATPERRISTRTDQYIPDRRISPAVGEWAILECARLRHDIERHVKALAAEVTESARLRESNAELLSALQACVTQYDDMPEFRYRRGSPANGARAAIAKAQP